MVRAATWLHFGSGGAGAALHDRDVDTPPRQIDREREPDRSCANDQHLPLSHVRHQSRLARRASAGPCFLSLRLGTGAFDDAGPALDLGPDERRKTVRRRSANFGSSDIVVSFSRVAGSAISFPAAFGLQQASLYFLFGEHASEPH
jgi:hypothetical protein